MLNTIKNIPLRILLSLSSAFAILCFVITIIISQSLLSEVDNNSDKVYDNIAFNSQINQFQNLFDASRMRGIYALGFYQHLDAMVQTNNNNLATIKSNYNKLRTSGNTALTPETRQSLEQFIDNFQQYTAGSEQLRQQRRAIRKIYDETSWISTVLNEADVRVTRDRSATDLALWNKDIAQMSDIAGLMMYNIAEGVKDQSKESTQEALKHTRSMLKLLQPFKQWPETKILFTDVQLWEQQLLTIIRLQNDKGNTVKNMIDLANNNTKLINALAEQSRANTEELSKTTDSLLSSVTTSQMTASAVAILLSITISVLLANAINQILRTLYLAVRDLANGKLDQQTNINGKNEIGMLGASLDDAIAQLGHTIRALRGVSDEVAASSTELAAVMTQSEVNGRDQQQQVEQIAAAVTELSAAATQVDGYAKTADETAQQALTLGSESTIIAKQARYLTQDLADQLNDTSSQVTDLNEQSIRISEVITVIDSISEQTNLLALNAAIEAARAGASGRGFAVVADEVRVLAAKTQDSTQQIQSIIEQLQQKSAAVVDSVNSSLDKVNSNNEITEQTSKQIDSISQALEQISQVNSDVTTSVDEQSRAIVDITESINNINDIINQNVAGISQTAEASNHLSRLAEDQKERLGEFQVAQHV
ncbi:methyl-accepting chemotaxis protein [uncultured Photobacterium sp.]|uniref:methyl-accepting chemotaxis protein n=1 Tax=uncultured Photobacterium sp. TaxID=173973 RepID=UPI002613B785|nr:methyl-accepting chemotaxis protein [uncultured Photobacterium sp.]